MKLKQSIYKRPNRLRILYLICLFDVCQHLLGMGCSLIVFMNLFRPEVDPKAVLWMMGSLRHVCPRSKSVWWCNKAVASVPSIIAFPHLLKLCSICLHCLISVNSVLWLPALWAITHQNLAWSSHPDVPGQGIDRNIHNPHPTLRGISWGSDEKVEMKQVASSWSHFLNQRDGQIIHC